MIKIRDLNRSITKSSDDYDEKYMKIKSDSDDDLPLNTTIEIHKAAIVVRAVFHENNKYYPELSLDECPYELWIINNIKTLYYDRIDVSEGIDINKTSAWKEVIFVTVSTF